MSNSENDKLNYSEDIMIEKLFWLCVNNSRFNDFKDDYDFDECTKITYSDNTLSIDYSDDCAFSPGVVYDFDRFFPVNDFFFFVNAVFPNTSLVFSFYYFEGDNGYFEGSLLYNMNSDTMRFSKRIKEYMEGEDNHSNESGYIKARTIIERKSFFEHMIEKANDLDDHILADFLLDIYNSLYFPDKTEIINSDLENKNLLWAAFYGCKDLISISIPETFTCIYNNMFYNCVNLTSVIIPKSITSIGDNAFFDCKNLVSLNILGSINNIGDNTFKGCKKLTNNNGFVIVNNNLFYYTGRKTEVVIPDNVTYISSVCFFLPKSLEIPINSRDSV